MEKESIFKVSEINELIKSHIENNNNFKEIKIKGEVANLTFNKMGHIYFSLKEVDAKIDCAMWKFNAHKFLDLDINEGTEITAVGSLSLYSKTCKITFIATNIEIGGIGALALKYEKRYKELESKGWFDSSLKKPIPLLPKNIGIVTAATGDAVNDLITTIKRRYSIVNIYIFPALVQGDESAKDIAKKIKQANNFNIKLDVLIVGRGGGSYEDLWSFNEMEVLEAIHNSKIPIITGIGHDADVTLSDYVADLRASTPTAAGEKATQDKIYLINNLNSKLINFGQILKKHTSNYSIFLDNVLLKNRESLTNKLNKNNTNLNILSNSITNNIIKIINKTKENLNWISKSYCETINNRIKQSNNELQFSENKINSVVIRNIEKYKASLMNYEQIIKLHDTSFILKKGYAILKDDKKIIRSVVELNNIDIINITLADGEKEIQIEKRGKNNEQI
ncbi:exodeoxyribonuclease VII large subunit [Spiroplasma corruscae]|uniref:Exodeoxyribonuclease 7 large subunit n=1 Tax=Spiroplasma corruscae TaxID=216934 RepID=A0A222EP07_9MOLU|nr:exodeoxyribonuclease VII large subunit [Spiroplasma corruscae]ASP28256.1 exodeoxyribonuclease VII large subunit [Spiroplasma corruscae]